MEPKAAKELLHIRAWLTRVDEIVRRGKEAYLGLFCRSSGLS